MKILKRIIPLVGLLLAIVLLFNSCGRIGTGTIREVVQSDLNQLKGLNEETVQNHLSYTSLFPGSGSDKEIDDNYVSLFCRFFENFNYRILSVKKSGSKAAVSIKLTTLDAVPLAKDYTTEVLRHSIFSVANGENISDTVLSVSDRCSLLNQLLEENDYPKTTIHADMQLQKTDSEWMILQSDSFENALSGGLIAALSDSDLLSPTDIVQIYMDTMKEMNKQQLSNFLHVTDFTASEDENTQKIADALISQLISLFDYSINDSDINGYSAEVTVVITTFDSDSIVREYKSNLEEYITSIDAVVDGYDQRISKSSQMLYDAIISNENYIQVPIVLTLYNDGVSWTISSPGDVLGPALFGTIPEEENNIYEENT